ncbi:hypothetical protein [Actinocrispum wychmicini]|uniref:Acetyltransferase (GNAT) family protein n=1 Tax=Actinocrispum wychmicini TaxID=1213861 RepID=A0A4R2JN00_9PSEU|nr:hypothetical protein [Actinocrispum wychmicini]TCO60684.1 hypothetical protein EV192_103259 [Actinocrispum wychmicini]
MVRQFVDCPPAGHLVAGPVTPFQIAGVTRLAAGADRLDMTGIRFDEGATTAMSTDPDHLAVSFAVSGELDANEIVGAAWIRRRGQVWWVLNLVLRHRDFGLAAVEWLAREASVAGAAVLVGRYVPAGHNAGAEDFWEQAGFTPSGEDGVFTLAVTTYRK